MKKNDILVNIIKKFIDDLGKPVPGKKALQKLIYFAQVEGLPLGFDYILYKYGPYSFELEDEIKEMEFFELIKITPNESGYKIDFSGDVPLLKTEEERIIEKVIKRFGSYTPRELELFSTVHFIATDMADIYKVKDPQEILERIKAVKQEKYSWEEIEAAYHNLKEWQLI